MKLRKAISLTCLSLAVLYSTGLYFGFLLMKKQIRTEIKQSIKCGISQNQLTTLTFSLEETNEKITWLEDDEFIYEGQTYDVVSRKELPGSKRIVFNVITDKQEKVLFEGLTNMVNSDLHKGNGKKTTDNLAKIFGLKYLSTTNELHLISATKEISPSYSINLEYTSPYTGIQSPPPDFI